MSKVLIAYVTKTGTTKRAAEIIAKELVKNGFDTNVIKIAEIHSIDDYDAVIIGGPIIGMRWHPDASKFVSIQAFNLANKDVSYFFVSYIMFTGKDSWKARIRNAFDSLSRDVKPRMKGMFGGKIEKPFPSFARWIFGVKKDAPIDVQSDEDVQKWAIKWVEGYKEKSFV